MTPVRRVTSRDNPLLVLVRRLAHDGSAYRKAGRVWLEGDHLCAAWLERGNAPLQALLTEAAAEDRRVLALADQAEQVSVVTEALFRGVSGLESSAGIGFIVEIPAPTAIDAGAASVVLDRIQDAGNVGSILRSAAAFGVGQVLALPGTAALWSPKVLRAGMGAHFGLRLHEGLSAEGLAALQVPMLATMPHAGVLLPQAVLPSPCAWVFGHEGQGVGADVLQRCVQQVCIPQPGVGESLNVAAAAAVCLYESARQRVGR